MKARVIWAWLSCSLLLSGIPVQSENWLESVEVDQTVYFLFSSPARIERFDMSSNSFLAPVALPGAPSDLAADSSGLYVNNGASVYRYDLNVDNPEFRFVAPSSVQEIALTQNHIIALHGNDDLLSAVKTTGQIVQSLDFWYPMQGLSADPQLPRIFACTKQSYPPDIVSILIGEDGVFGVQNDSPYHGETRAASETFVKPGSGTVFDNGGTRFTGDLVLAGGLGGRVDHVAFLADGVIASRASSVVWFDDELLEVGEVVPSQPSRSVSVRDGIVYSFFVEATTRGVGVESFAMVDFALPVAPYVDPVGLAYVPDRIVTDSDGNVYVLSTENSSVFIWSAALQQYVGTISLRGPAEFLVGIPSHGRLYVGYSSGVITYIDIYQGFEEKEFVTTPHNLTGLTGVDSGVFAMNGNDLYSSRALYTYDGTGNLADRWNFQTDWSAEYVWDPVYRRIYHLRDHWSPNDIRYMEIHPDLRVGDVVDSPYHGQIEFHHPVRVSPSGKLIAIGTGRVFNESLQSVDNLATGYVDAVWVGRFLYTVASTIAGSSRVGWASGAGLDSVGYVSVDGEPLAILHVPQGVVVVTDVAGIPQFTLLDTRLGLPVGHEELAGILIVFLGIWRLRSMRSISAFR